MIVVHLIWLGLYVFYGDLKSTKMRCVLRLGCVLIWTKAVSYGKFSAWFSARLNLNPSDSFEMKPEDGLGLHIT